jgi:hypothetical protein
MIRKKICNQNYIICRTLCMFSRFTTYITRSIILRDVTALAVFSILFFFYVCIYSFYCFPLCRVRVIHHLSLSLVSYNIISSSFYCTFFHHYQNHIFSSFTHKHLILELIICLWSHLVASHGARYRMRQFEKITRINPVQEMGPIWGRPLLEYRCL